MSFLGTARETLDRYMPGLDKQLEAVPLADLEKPGNEALAMFRASGGPALLVPAEFGGMGATIAEAVHVQRAIGSRSPSLAVATTMHHFSVASLVELDAGWRRAFSGTRGRPVRRRGGAVATAGSSSSSSSSSGTAAGSSSTAPRSPARSPGRWIS